ncbi:MAG: formamidopyrimidine-DNA glycosylase [Thermoleophilia bacterium]|nr:formamidopyrimidine-DNA glycosylase [Thermoleophilia bacterium]
MPEIPDIEAYIEALRPRVLGLRWLGVRLVTPFLLRTVNPPLESLVGGRVTGVERLGKRIVVEIARQTVADSGPGQAPSFFLVLHLMIAGRLHWKPPGAAVSKGTGLAAFDLEGGTLLLTEAGKKRRASLHVLEGREALAALGPGGLEVIGSTPEAFAEALGRDNHTLKRALTDPHVLSGIGNAYSDEILHRARLSPFKQTRTLGAEEMERLHTAAVAVLQEWTERLRVEARLEFPEKVTAFRPEMAVHGRFGAACPVCGTLVQRIVYAENECDYCPTCQTDGRIMADRALSRLLRDDWPGVVDDLARPPGANDLPQNG